MSCGGSCSRVSVGCSACAHDGAGSRSSYVYGSAGSGPGAHVMRPNAYVSIGASATPDLSDAFLIEVVRVAGRLGISPFDLLLVMNRESGISPAASNPQGAAGLIQFTNLGNVGWTGTREQFLALSGVQQLPYVERFLKRSSRYNLNSAGRLHQALFVPASLPGSMQPDLPLVRKDGTRWTAPGECNEACIYRGHAFLDVGSKGYITAGDLETIDRRDAAPPNSPYSRAVARLAQLGVVQPTTSPADESPLLRLVSLGLFGFGVWTLYRGRAGSSTAMRRRFA